LSRRDRCADLRGVHCRHRPRRCDRQSHRRSRLGSRRDDGARRRVLVADRLRARRPRAHAADDADLPAGRHGHRLAPGLVRHLPRARAGDRLHSPADGYEPLRHTARRPRRFARSNFQGRSAVPHGGSRASRTLDRFSRDRPGIAALVGPMNGKTSVAEIDFRLREPLEAYRDGSGGIGFVGPDIPIEVLIASGRPFGHLPWRADRPTPWADRWLESSFPYWSRSILEQWHEGVFDALETVVFSRSDDASHRLYYYVRELQQHGKLRGPKPLVFDIALIPRESSLAHTETALIELMRALGVDVDALPDAIERANALRRSFARLESSRVANGPLYERLGRAALWANPCDWVDALRLPESTAAATRLLLAGSTPPDERLHEAAEAAGASIVSEANALALGRLGPELDAASARAANDERGG